MINLEKCLCCLFFNPDLKFSAISSSLSSLKTMGGTIGSTLVSGSVLAVGENEDAEEVKVEGKGDVDGRVNTL